MSPDQISIVIPTYNRYNSLYRTLNSCISLKPCPHEIIVIDDASSDDTESIAGNFQSPLVKCIRLPENRGQAYARSLGMEMAKGAIVVSLDDDSYFMDSDALIRISRQFRERPDCGILAFRIFTPGENIAPSEDRLFYTSDHITCGCAYRKSLLNKIGYHLMFIHSGGEEADISLKAFDAGYSILQDYNIRVFHEFEPDKRPQNWHITVRKQTMRNDLLEVLVRYPSMWVLPAIGAKIVSHFRFACRHHLVVPSLMALYEFLKMMPLALKHRKPVKSKTIRRYLQLRGSAVEIKLNQNL